MIASQPARETASSHCTVGTVGVQLLAALDKEATVTTLDLQIRHAGTRSGLGTNRDRALQEFYLALNDLNAQGPTVFAPGRLMR